MPTDTDTDATAPRVLLTRPDGENDALRELLEEKGLSVAERPIISLVALDVTPALKTQAINLDEQDLLIFVSKAAVNFGMALIDQYWPALPERLQVFAVGPGTADVLNPWGVHAHYPEAAGSEGLLAMPGLNDVNGASVMIARGTGGRELLATTLGERGAKVSYFETYERRQNVYTDLATCLPGQARSNIVVLTSGEIVQYFASAFDGDLRRVHAVVASARIAEAASEYSFASVTNAGGASTQSLYDAVVNLLQ